MRSFYIVVILLIAWEALRRLRSAMRPERLGPVQALPLGLLGALVAGLTLSLGAQLWIAAFAERHALVAPAWANGFPIRVLFDSGPFHEKVHRILSAAMLAIAVFQTALLVIAARSLSDTRDLRVRWTIGVGATMMALLSLAAPVLTSGDAYAYIGYAHLGRAAYAPPAVVFPGELAAINAYLKVPMIPTNYGPLWLGSTHFLVGWVTQLRTAVILLRVENIVLFILLLALLRAAGCGGGVVTLVALNPMLFFQFIANAHNDLLGLVLVVGALAVIGRPWIAAAIVGAAGLVKIPFLIVGVFVLTRLPDIRTRVLTIAFAVGSAAIVSLAVGGRGYVHAVLGTNAALHLRAGTDVLRAVLGIAVFVSIGLAISGRRVLTAMAWAIPALAPTTYPWYFAWSVGWLATTGTGLRLGLAALPIVAMILDPVWSLIGLTLPLALLTLAAIVVDTVRSRRAVLVARR